MRKLVSIQRIKDIQPIPDADRIDVATVLGWKIVIKKNEFKVGDLCVYYEIDSLIPRRPWNDFLAKKENPDAPIRLRTIKMRKQISQGLVMPLSILPSDIGEVIEGQDITEKMGVTKYEPPISITMGGQAKGAFPSLIPKTDEMRVQAVPDIVKEFSGWEVYWSLKIDGTSGTFVNIDGEPYACSRNISWAESEGNLYWKIYRKYGLDKLPEYLAVQGEIAGPGIEKNTMGLKEIELFVFNVYDVRAAKYLDYSDLIEICKVLNLQTVPILKVEPFTCASVDELVEITNSAQYPNKRIAEGYVIRPVMERYSETLSGRASFKVVSNKYLLEND